MLHNKEAAQVVISAIDTFKPTKIVLDPVMISTSGSKLLEDDTIDIITRELFKRVTLVTPNIDEAAFLSGMTIRNEEEMETAAYHLMEMGCNALLMKGGHLGKEEMADILYMKDKAPIRFTVPAIDTFNSHGTGCTLSSAIAAYLALGKDLREAVRMAKQYITTALSEGANVKTGHGYGPLNHFFAPVPLIKIER